MTTNAPPRLTLRPYPSYKDSGLWWLRNIPEHWEVRRLRHLFRVLNGATPSSADADNWDGDIVWITPDDLGRLGGRSISDSKRHLTEKGFSSCAAALGHVGSIVLSTRAPIGHLAITQVAACVNQGCRLLMPVYGGSPEYWYYQLLATRHELEALGQGSTFTELSRVKLLAVGLVVPPLDERKGVAQFLEAFYRRINRLVLAKRRLITLLNEQKQAIIHRAITRGLDPNVRLKPSGVDWLGDIPEHWEVQPLFRRYSTELGKMLDTKRITGQHPVRYVRNVNVQWDRLDLRDLQIMDIAPSEYGRFTLEPGDMLVCEGGDIGRSAFWTGELALCGYQKALHRVRVRDARRDNPRFLYHFMFIASKSGAFLANGSENTIAHLTGVKLRAQRIPCPPFEEQQAIAAELAITVSNLERAIDCTYQEIDLLREYRTRLIADVVTGKLDVRGVELPAIEDNVDMGDEGLDLDESEADGLDDSEEEDHVAD